MGVERSEGGHFVCRGDDCEPRSDAEQGPKAVLLVLFPQRGGGLVEEDELETRPPLYQQAGKLEALLFARRENSVPLRLLLKPLPLPLSLSLDLPLDQVLQANCSERSLQDGILFSPVTAPPQGSS